MSFHDEPARERRSKSQTETEGGAAAKGGKRKPQAGQVGDALRTVYQRTVDEAIPPEMLDLLGKLG